MQRGKPAVLFAAAPVRISTMTVNSDLTVDELKSVIHEVLAEDMENWRETLEIMADRKLMKQIREADADWKTNREKAYLQRFF